MTLQINGSFTAGNTLKINSNGYEFTIISTGAINIGDNFTGTVNLQSTGNNIKIGGDASMTGNINALGSLTVGGSSTVNGSCSYASTNFTCTNDKRTVSIAAASGPEGNSGTKTLTFTATLNATSSNTITLQYAATDGTATTADSDYIAASGTLTFLAGQSSQTFNVTINGDTKYEANETFAINLSSSNGALSSNSSATGTISNDDTAPTITIANTSLIEGNTGQSNMSFTVSQSAVSGLATTAHYATTPGTATPGSSCTTVVDYLTQSGTMTIAVSATTGTITVPICGDTSIEADETFTVTLSNPANATLGTASTGTGTIVNDDVAVEGGGLGRPFSFNCVEVGSNALSGHLFTKLAGTGFSLDIVALKDSNSDGIADAAETTYAASANKSVTVELVDATGGGACTVPSPAVSQTVTFASADSGRKTTSFMVSNAYSNLVCRVTDSNQSPSIVGCSTDNFAIRPASFTVTSTNATADSTGTSATATPAIKTGASFNLAATAVAGYNGTPLIDTSKLQAHSGAVNTGSLTGSFTAASTSTGVASNSSFAYSEVGYFALASDGVYDNTFAALDSANGDCTADFSNSAVSGRYGCNFGNTAQTNYFGRFIPDHLVTSVLSNGSFAHSCSTFTYNGQSLNYGSVTHPMLNIFPYNASSPASITRNYTGIFNRLLASHFTLTAPTTDALKKGVDNINLVKLSAALATPTLNDYGSGNLTLKLGSDIFTYQRESNAMIAPFSNAIAVTVNSVADSDGVMSTTLPMVLQPSGENIYYGRINLMNAYGSELLDLPMPLTAEYWNGTGWVLNTADQCTTGIILSAALVAGPLASVCAWDTGVGNGSSGLGCSIAGTSINQFSQPPLVTNGGNFNLNFKAPGVNNTGAMDITATVPSYLNFNWKGAGNTNPTARATFGIYKGNSKIIYIREVY